MEAILHSKPYLAMRVLSLILYHFSGSTDTTDPSIQSYRTNTQAGANGYTHEYNKSTTGRVNKYNINLSSLYLDKLYLGVNINFLNVEYTERVNFYEYGYGPQSGINELNFRNELITLGTGSSFQIGAIYKVNNQLRMGLSLESPTYYRLSDRVRQALNTSVVTQNSDVDINLNPLDQGIETVFPEYQFNAPGSIRGSLAYIVKDIGLISLDYSVRSHDSARFTPVDDDLFRSLNNQIEENFQASQRLQIGGEFKIKPTNKLTWGI